MANIETITSAILNLIPDHTEEDKDYLFDHVGHAVDRLLAEEEGVLMYCCIGHVSHCFWAVLQRESGPYEISCMISMDINSHLLLKTGQVIQGANTTILLHGWETTSVEASIRTSQKIQEVFLTAWEKLPKDTQRMILDLMREPRDIPKKPTLVKRLTHFFFVDSGIMRTQTMFEP